jgi:hypothetical protein
VSASSFSGASFSAFATVRLAKASMDSPCRRLHEA